MFLLKKYLPYKHLNYSVVCLDHAYVCISVYQPRHFFRKKLQNNAFINRISVFLERFGMLHPNPHSVHYIVRMPLCSVSTPLKSHTESENRYSIILPALSIHYIVPMPLCLCTLKVKPDAGNTAYFLMYLQGEKQIYWQRGKSLGTRLIYR